MSLPIVAIIGRPNVGKSTLFNCLIGKRDALVADISGLTRDRQYGYVSYCDSEPTFIVTDTGGIGDKEEQIDELVDKQAEHAILEAALIIFVVDAKSGLTSADMEVALRLRRADKPVLFVLNKVDGYDPDIVNVEFYKLGFGKPIPIAARQRRGIKNLLNCIKKTLPKYESKLNDSISEENAGIKVAIIGHPNVGKSTLVNRILCEERVIAFDKPGTTRDSIFIPFDKKNKHYTLIDTAGVRKRWRVKETIEKFSVIKTLNAIELSHVVVFLIDASEGVTEWDLKLLGGHILELGRSLVIAVNKWDCLTMKERYSVKLELKRRLHFADYAKWHFISALRGYGISDLFNSINKAYQSAMLKLSTPKLTRILEKAIAAFAPPLIKGRRVKLRYAHSGGNNPPTIIIHGSRTKILPKTYKRYLENTYRTSLKLVGTPVRIELRSGNNPYSDKK